MAALQNDLKHQLNCSFNTFTMCIKHNLKKCNDFSTQANHHKENGSSVEVTTWPQRFDGHLSCRF